MIKHIAFTAYPVKEMARARTFYEQTLGLKPAESFGEMWQEYDVAEGTFALVVTTGEDIPEFWKRPAASIAFEVDDLDAEVERVRGLGVKVVVEPFQTPVCKAVVIEDPEGNAVSLHQMTR